MKNILFAALSLIASCFQQAMAQDVLILGEIHDNPHHHAVQAERVAILKPAAIVFEMLTPEQAAVVTPDLIADKDALEDALDWGNSGWPDFSLYYPIFTAADARIHGAAVPRKVARQAVSDGGAAVFGTDAGLYGLSTPLPEKEQTHREALQAAAHCDALPDDMLAPMVAIQRLRDASLARAVVLAMAETGGPVAVITGNGHARRDWGMPAVLTRVAPELDVHVVGQTEDNTPLQGGFDEVVSSPSQPRPDPCLAFQ